MQPGSAPPKQDDGSQSTWEAAGGTAPDAFPPWLPLSSVSGGIIRRELWDVPLFLNNTNPKRNEIREKERSTAGSTFPQCAC